MPYVPNPLQATEPTESREIVTAAREFRELKASVNSRLAALKYIVPQQFGAVGDGVADDTAAIQAFFDNITTYGQRATIPAGQYNLRAPVTITMRGPGFSIEGAGVEAAIFTINNNFVGAGPAIQLIGSDAEGSAVDFPGFSIGGFSIRAASGGLHGDVTVGLQVGSDSASLARLAGYQWRTIHDLLIANFPTNLKVVHARMIVFNRIGLYADETPSTNLHITQNGLSTNDLIFDTCQFVSTNVPGRLNVHIESPVGPYTNVSGNCSVSGINFKSCDIYGAETAVKVHASDAAWISELWFEAGCQVDQSVTYGFAIESSDTSTLIENVHIVDGWVNFTGGYGIQLIGTGTGSTGMVKNVWISGNTFYRNTTAAITTFGFGDQINNINITDNIFSNCDSAGGAIVLNNIYGANVTGNVARRDFLFSAQPKYLVEIIGTTDAYVVTGNRGVVGPAFDVETAVVYDTASGTRKVVRGNVGTADAETVVTASDVVFSPAGPGSVDATVETKLRESVSVKDFGAVGDGVTDDTAAIQAAIDASAGKTLVFPPGIYTIGNTLQIPSGIHLVGDRGQAVLKLLAKNWTPASGLLFSVSLGDTDVCFDSLTFDGNKGNVGTSRSPLIVIYRSQRISFKNCVFQNVEGICLNTSNDVDDYKIIGCKFLSCGGNPDNSDGYRKQAIAFSSDGVYRSQNILIQGNYFYRQGLDCISLSDCDNVTIANNTAVESYTLVYNTPLPRTTRNLVIDGNLVSVCSEFGAGTSTPPLAIDLPSVDGASITGNFFSEIDAAAIGIFHASANVTITGNNIINPMRGGAINFVSGIIIGSSSGNTAVNNLLVEGNLIVDNASSPLMNYGITVKSDAINVLVRDNVIRNPLSSRYGVFSTSPFLPNISAFTSTSQVSSSCRIVDLDLANNLETVHGRLYLQTTDNTNPAVRINQLGSGACFVVEDQATPDGTSFSIDSDGDVGIRISPATFGGPFSVSGTGNANINAFQAYGNDAHCSVLNGYKTRNASPYAQTIVQNGDILFRLQGFGSDGVGYRQAAYVQIAVDGNPGANNMPGRIEFWTTPANATTAVLRLSVNQNGALRFTPQTQPATASAGDVYYDSAANKLRCFNGSVWENLS